MKKDLRRQTFSKPEKPNDEEIKSLTGESEESNAETTKPKPIEPTPEIQVSSDAIKVTKKSSNGDKFSNDDKSETQTQTVTTQNPFLLSRGQDSEITVEKTGYRVRSDYMDLLKLVKRIKKGHTLEAVLDDALTFYFENSEDGQKAVKQKELLNAE